MKRPSPLETLKDLRQRAQESEQSRLASRSQSERQAELAEKQARQLLIERAGSRDRLRRAEQQRLAVEGISAAEGQRRLAWERAERAAIAQLSEDVARAVSRRRETTREHERARRALQRAHAELEEVERQLGQRERQVRQRAEQAQQETLDEVAARRFTGRHDA